MSTKEIYVQLAKSTKIMLCFKTSSSKSYLKTSGKSCTKMTNKWYKTIYTPDFFCKFVWSLQAILTLLNSKSKIEIL